MAVVDIAEDGRADGRVWTPVADRPERGKPRRDQLTAVMPIAPHPARICDARVGKL